MEKTERTGGKLPNYPVRLLAVQLGATNNDVTNPTVGDPGFRIAGGFDEVLFAWGKREKQVVGQITSQVDVVGTVGFGLVVEQNIAVCAIDREDAVDLTCK